MSDPNVGVMMRWVLSIGWLTGRPAELRESQGWSGWTDTELAGPTPAPLQHLLSICPRHAHTREEVTRVSRPTLLNLAGSVWATLPVIGHQRVTSDTVYCWVWIWSSMFVFPLFGIHGIYSDLKLSHTLLIPISISPLNVRWQKLLISFSWPLFSDCTQKLCLLSLVLRKLRFGRTCWL